MKKENNLGTTLLKLVKRVMLTCVVSLAFTVVSSYAQKTSTGSGAWNNAATWTPAGVPGATDIVTVAAGHIVTVPASATCKQLLISGTVDMTAGSSITMDITNNSSAGPTNGLQLNSGSNLIIGATNTVYFSNGQASGIVNNGGTIASTGTNGVNGGTILANTCCGGEFRVSGSAMTTVYNLTFLQNANFNIASGGLFVNGTLSVPNNNFNSNGTTLSPIYGTASTLFINNGGQGLGGGTPLNGNLNKLWAVQTGTIGVTPGYPNNVTLVNLGTSSGGVTPAGGSNINVGWRPTGAVGLNGTLRMGDGTGGNPGSNPTGSVIGSLDQVSSFSCGGIIVDNNSTLISPGAVPYTVNGNFILQGATTGLYYSFSTSTNINFAGTGTSASPQTISTNGTSVAFPIMTVSNGTYVQLQKPVTISSTLNLTAGYIGTTATNSLTVTNTVPAAVTGGSSTSYVDGPLTWSFPASGAGNYTFPVGDLSHNGGAYLPITLASASSTGGTNVTATAFHQDLGGFPDATVTSLSHTDYWSVSTTTAFSNGAMVSVSRPTAVAPNNSLASSSTASGTYTSIGGTPSGSSMTGAGIGSGSPVFLTLVIAPLNVVRVGGISAGVDASCNPTTGSLIVGGVGGTAPYTYSVAGFNGGAFQSSTTFSPLAKGAYTVTIKDATNATQTAVLHVLGPLQINGNDQDMTICTGASATLTANNLQNSSPTFSWTSSPAGFTASTATITPSPTVATTYTVTSTVYATNLLVGGDFESGPPTGFSASGATYFTTHAPYTGTPDNGGHYAIGTSGSALCTCFSTLPAQSGSNFYMADGYVNNTVPNLFDVTVGGLTPGTTYVFSFWYAQATGNPNKPQLQIVVSGGTIASGPAQPFTVGNSAVWTQATYNITATTSSVTITFNDPYNDPAGTDGNDIFLDNLQFTGPCTVSTAITVTPGPCCPKGQIAGNASICNDGTSTTTLTVSLTGTAPWTFTYAIDGVDQTPITTSLSTYTFQSATGAHTYTLTNVQDAVYTTCTGNYSGSAVVTTKPVSTITSSATGTVCSGAAQNYTITSSIASTYSWSRALVTNISNAAVSNQTTNPITEILNNTSTGAVVVRYVITPTASGCAGTPFNYDVTVNPIPAITSAATGNICSGSAQNYTITSNITSTYSWSRAAVTNISNAAVTAQTANPIIEALTNTSTSAVVVRYIITPTASGCAGTPFNYDVTVNPAPSVTSAATGNICSGIAENYTITSNIGTATFSWGRAAVTNISNAAVTAQTANPITETLLNTSTSAVVVRYIITPTAAGCAGTPFNYDVTVKPTPAVTSAATGSVCSGAAQNYSITSNVTSTYSWSRAVVTNISNGAVAGQTTNPITEILNNTSTGAVVVRYVITPTASGCAGTPFNYDVTVNPAPVVNSAATGTVCSGAAQNYDLTDNTGTATFSWGRAAVTNISNAAVSAQTADPITEALTNTSANPVLVTYLITPSAGGCTGAVFTYKVTVNPTPVVNSSATGSVCSGAAQNYTITSNVTGTTFSWDRGAVANISNAAVTGQTANPITEALTLTGVSSTVVTYVITPTAATCSGTPFNYNVTVNPAPTISSASTGSICSGIAQSYTITSPTGTATFSWSRAVVTNISNAAASAQTSNPITETLNNTSTGAVVVTYVITPAAGGCNGTPFNYNVTVNPAPKVTSAATGSVCSGAAQNYDITDNMGATYSWDRAAVANISNAAATGQTADPITEMLTNTSTTPTIVTYVITPTAGGCTGTAFSYKVTVNPTPSVNSAASGSVCTGVAQNYDITSNVATATFSWDRATAANISNAAVSAQTSDPITESLINTSTSNATVTYQITPSVGGCAGSPFIYTLTVKPAPTVTSASTGSICSGTAQNYTITSNIGTSYTWSRASVSNISNASVSGQTSNPIAESLNSISASNVVVRYVIVPVAGGCSGTSFNYDVTVNPAPSVSSTSAGTVCSGSPLNYTITSATGSATFSWSRAAVANISNPAVSGQSSNPITETLVNTGTSSATVRYVIVPSAGGCAGASFNYDVTVVSPPMTSQIPSGNQICEGSDGAVTIPGSESGIMYQAYIGGNSVSNASAGTGSTIVLPVSTSQLSLGSNTITVHVSGCSNAVLTNTTTITVTAIPVANAGPDIQVDDFTSITLDGTGSSSGIYNWSSSDGSVIANPSALSTTAKPQNVYSYYTLTVTDAANTSCQATDVVYVKISPKPVNIPNAFSPNGDGIHDKFEIANIEFFKDAVLYVYNQWGELIYKSDAGYHNEWDGTRNGNPVPIGAYYYLLDFNMANYNSITGNITLVK